MERFARWIVKHRKTVLVIAVLLLIPSVFGAIGTYINYDILTYLPPELDSMIGEEYLEDDFKTASTAMITIENMPTAQILSLKEKISAVDGVDTVMWISDMLDVSVPKEMLPEDIYSFFFNDNGATMMVVKFKDTSASASTMNALKQIKKLLKENCFIGGMSAILQDTKVLVYCLCSRVLSAGSLSKFKRSSGPLPLYARHRFSNRL